MSDTIPGGAYLAADGKTLVDSEGRPLSAEAQAQAEELVAKKNAAAAQAQQTEQTQQALAQTALRNVLLGGAPAAPIAAPAADDDEPAKGKHGGRR